MSYIRNKRRLWTISALAVLASAWACLAFAQTPVFTQQAPSSTLGGNESGTISATNVFQLVFGSTGQSPGSASRKGCTIINYGSHTMYVTEALGLSASTTTKAVQLAAGQSYYCSVNGTVLTGEIDISGTMSDAYYAAQY